MGYYILVAMLLGFNLRINCFQKYSRVVLPSYRRNFRYCMASLKEEDAVINTLPQFPVVGEELVYDGWRKVTRRDVIMPNGRKTSFDIFSSASSSIVVFVWDTKTKTTTLVQEYYPGLEKVMYGAVGGVYEEKKHGSVLRCAQFELEEEAHLQSNNWIPLLEGESNGIPFDKYSDNILHPYLALDCELVNDPRPIDNEEWITIHRNISYAQLMALLTAGQLALPTAFAVLLSMQRLKELGHKVE